MIVDILSSNIKEIISFIAAYFIGCFSTGYYLVRFRTGKDIRKAGSTSAGATNVKRIFGWRGFIITFAGDAAKGLIALGGALYFGIDQLGVVLVMIAVIAGHIWPVQLGFRGGKGIATAIGALLVLDYLLVFILLAFSAVLWVWSRRLTYSGLAATALSPVIVFLQGRPLTETIGVAAAAIIILLAHRDNIREIIRTFKKTRGI